MSANNTPALTPVNLPAKSERLTLDEATKIAGALHRLNEIKTGSNIISITGSGTAVKAKTEQEVTDLIGFLSENLIKHANELIGCYLVVKGELEPLVRAFIPIFQRTRAFTAAEEAKHAAPPAPEVIK